MKVSLFFCTFLISIKIFGCSLEQAETAFDLIDQTIFQSLSGAEVIGFGEASDQSGNGEVIIGMTNNDEILKFNAVFQGGLQVNNCHAKVIVWNNHLFKTRVTVNLKTKSRH